MIKAKFSSSERGQTIIIFVLGMLIVIGFIALVIDGGNLYWQRRVAQNAADAGALAGAAVLCSPGSIGLSDAEKITIAQNKAIEYIQANQALAVVDDIQVGSLVDSDGQSSGRLDYVEVDSTIQFETIFGGAIGVNSLSTSATARAVCLPAVAAEGPLPVSWTCKAAASGDEDPECVIEYPTGAGCTFGNDPYFIFADMHGDVPLGVSCALPAEADNPPDGKVDCAAIGIQIVENEVNGAWLDLTGTDAGVNASAWTQAGYYGFPGYLNRHTWYPNVVSNFENAFSAIDEYRLGSVEPLFPVVVIPVYDVNFMGDPSSNANASWHNGQDAISGNVNTSRNYFHIASLASFQIMCVDTGPDDSCPGESWLLDQLNDQEHDHETSTRLRTVEGCFTHSPVMGPRGTTSNASDDTGAYSVTLVK